MTTTTEYSSRSSARRAAKAAGLDPDQVQETASGKFRLPPANKPMAEMTEASRLAMPSAKAGNGLDMTGGEDGGIPAFLKVANRKPLTAAQQKKLAANIATVSTRKPERTDSRKPKGTSWEDWDAHVAAETAAKREKTLERFAELKETYGRRKPVREDAFRPDQVIKILAKKNPCREGTAAHTVFEKYRDGLTVAQFAKAAAGVCPGRLRPIDYLIYDSRKGRISVGGTPAAQVPAPKKGKKK